MDAKSWADQAGHGRHLGSGRPRNLPPRLAQLACDATSKGSQPLQKPQFAVGAGQEEGLFNTASAAAAAGPGAALSKLLVGAASAEGRYPMGLGHGKVGIYSQCSCLLEPHCCCPYMEDARSTICQQPC